MLKSLKKRYKIIFIVIYKIHVLKTKDYIEMSESKKVKLPFNEKGDSIFKINYYF